jgi:superoxide dismutase, Cu-Zn family
LKKITMIGLSILLVLLLAACGNNKKEELKQKSKIEAAASGIEPGPVIIHLINNEGKKAGKAILTQEAEGVKVNVQAAGVKPGKHGIHFHEKAICTPPDFKSAGEHFNPAKKKHGFLNPHGPHAGDMENIEADNNGVIDAEVLSTLVTLSAGKQNSLFKNGGSALVIHERADDYKTDPAGDSGARIICGVIKK